MNNGNRSTKVLVVPVNPALSVTFATTGMTTATPMMITTMIPMNCLVIWALKLFFVSIVWFPPETFTSSGFFLESEEPKVSHSTYSFNMALSLYKT
jgi:hypothetical protein